VKPPRYPLAAVLEQRTALKKNRARRLALALGAAEDAKRGVQEAEQAKAHLEADREARAAHLYDPDPSGMISLPLVHRRTEEVKNLDGRIAAAAQSLEQAKTALAQAEAAAEAARLALTEADRDLQIVEKHHEGWLAALRREKNRLEERQAEEVVLARHAAELQERGQE
jgi:flagellar biosynthesis chaperone FliJ